MSGSSTTSTFPSLTSSALLSPIRRQSSIPQIRSNIPKDEERNDDDAERSSLVASDRALATSTPLASGSGRHMSTPQIEHFQGCLKLYAEHKINKDNAWNLQLIDLMISMLRRNDDRMNNLQIASTVISASASIYSFRVDAIHYDALKMAGGLRKAVQSKRGKKDEAPTEGVAAAPKKKKKRSKPAVAANPEILNGDFVANDCIDPIFARLALIPGDVTSVNKAFNATLPIHDETLALMLTTDDQFLEHINENASEELELKDNITIAAELLPAFLETDHICEPFTGFTISNWNPETEDSDNRVTNWVEENMLNISQQALAFDMNAEVEPIPQEEGQYHLFEDEPLAGISSDEDAGVGLATCVARMTPARPTLTELRPSAPHHARLEYSYCGIVGAWAGPAHWRFKENRALKMSGRSQSTGRLITERKRPLRRERQLDFLGLGLAFDAKSNDLPDYEPRQTDKITISRKTLDTGKRWNEANFKTPINRGLDEAHFRKLFLRRNVLMMRKQDEQKQDTEPLTVENNKDNDYNNKNHASYCSNHVPDGDEWASEDVIAARDLQDQVRHAESEELADLLEPPTKVAKTVIPYAMRAKKVNMRQLKHSIWEMLTENTPHGESEIVTQTSFFNIYSRLPNKLTPNMQESLSIPLALSSLLHLASEKGLVLETRNDLKDIGIMGLNKN